MDLNHTLIIDEIKKLLDTVSIGKDSNENILTYSHAIFMTKVGTHSLGDILEEKEFDENLEEPESDANGNVCCGCNFFSPKEKNPVPAEERRRQLVEKLDQRDLYSVTPKGYTILIKGIYDFVSNLHNSGYIHRDIKPENIRVDLNESLLTSGVIDFTKVYFIDHGTVANFNDRKKAPRRLGPLVGTPVYVPNPRPGSKDTVSNDYYASAFTIAQINSFSLGFSKLNSFKTDFFNTYADEIVLKAGDNPPKVAALSLVAHNSSDVNAILEKVPEFVDSKLNRVLHGKIKSTHASISRILEKNGADSISDVAF